MQKDANSTTHANDADSNMGRPVTPEEVYAHRNVIMGVANRSYRKVDVDSQQDLLQEVALKCWNDPRVRYNAQKGELAAYLATLARTTLADMWRKSKHVPSPMEDIDLWLWQDDKAPDTDGEELHERRRRMLARGIEKLYRNYPSKTGVDAFVMFSRDGMHAKAVADRLRVDEGFVNVAVHRGMERLKKIVRQMERDDEWRDAC